MKKITITLTIMAAVLTGCTSTKSTVEPLELSWTAFCAARGYDAETNEDDIVNEYLDTWRGSVEEEEVFIANGVEPC